MKCHNCDTMIMKEHMQRAKLHFLLSGETLPLSSGNKITIKFTTVGTETAKGFHFVYQGKF